MSVDEILATSLETVDLDDLDDLGDVNEQLGCGMGCGGSSVRIN